MEERKRLLKNTLIIALGNMGAKVISFLLLPLYTSLLSTSEYGTYDLIITIGSFLLPVVTLCMQESMFRFIIEYKDDESKFDIIITHTSVIFASGLLILVGISFILSRFINIPYLNYIVLYVITASLFTYSNNLLRASDQIKQYAIVSSVKNILQLILNVVCILVLKTGIEGLLISLYVSELVAFLWVFFRNKLWNHFKLNTIDFSFLKEMLIYSLPLIPNSICGKMLYMSDRLIIGAVLGPNANGIYSISYKFPNIIESLYHYFYNAWCESASRVISKGKSEAEKYYNQLYKTINDITFSSILLMISCMPILFRIFIRGDYIEGFNYVPILTLSMYCSCMSQFYSGMFAALKETKIIAKTTVISAFINLAVTILLIFNFGLYAAAISSLISNAFILFLRIKKLNSRDDINIHNISFIKECVFSIIILSLSNYNSVLLCTISIIISVFYFIYINSWIFKSIIKV